MTYIILVKEFDGISRDLPRPYVKEYNDWKQDGISLPEDCLNSEAIREYNTHNTFETKQEAQATIDWFIAWTLKNANARIQNHFSNPDNFKIVEQ